MPGYDLVIKGENKGPKLLSGEGSAVGLLADYAVAAQITDLPPEVIDHARRVLLDTIGVILGGSIAPEATALAHRLGRQDGGPSTIIGHALRASTLNAALANGTAATWLDYDSGHRPPPGKPLLPAAHPPIHLVPAILGVSEEMAASGVYHRPGHPSDTYAIVPECLSRAHGTQYIRCDRRYIGHPGLNPGNSQLHSRT